VNADVAGGYQARLDVGRLEPPALVIHGGAGTFEWLERLGEGASGRVRAALESSLNAGWAVLDGGSGSGALAAVVEAVACMESSGVFNAGLGSVPTTAGTVEMDAAVMEGDGCRAGAVCATTWPANPVRAALLVAGLGQAPSGGPVAPLGRTGPVVPAGPGRPGRPGGGAQGQVAGGFRPLLLAGNGADEFARAAGLERMSPITKTPGSPGRAAHGTVGAVAADAEGHVAAATSTGGVGGQPPGRVGDSPIIGAGTWADDSTAAVSGTGMGEAFILAGFGHRVDWMLRQGSTPGEALVASLGAVALRGGTGGGIVLTPSGEFAAAFGTRAMARAWRCRSEVVVRL